MEQYSEIYKVSSER